MEEWGLRANVSGRLNIILSRKVTRSGPCFKKNTCYLRKDQRDRGGSSESVRRLVAGEDGCTQRSRTEDRGAGGIRGLFQGCRGQDLLMDQMRAVREAISERDVRERTTWL